jgi:ABC-type uncharacterized transport system involved in gliding motility auxiliary subunit
MNSSARGIVTATLVLLLLVFVQVISELVDFRFDLTEAQRHSLSDATRTLLRQIDDPVTISYYVSDELRDRFGEPDRVEDIVRSYDYSGGELVRSRVISVDSSMVESEQLPILAQEIAEESADARSVRSVYSGIVVEYLGRASSIPFLFDSRDLEYRLTTLLRSLTREGLPVLGVVPGSSAGLSESSLLQSELSVVYDTVEFQPGEPLEQSLAVLLITNAQNLTERELLPVDEFLSNGGSALILGDPGTVLLDGSLRVQAARLDPLNTLLRKYGLELGSQFLLDGNSNDLPVQTPGEAGPVNQFVPYPLWPRIQVGNADRGHPLTRGFPGLDLYWSGPLRILPGHPAAPEALALSSPGAWLMEPPLTTDPNAAIVRGPDARSLGQYPVVATGTTGDSSVVLIGDSDLVRDLLIETTGSYYNIEFVVQALQFLSDEEELLALRNRSVRDLSLDGVTDPEARRALERFAVFVTLILIPLALAAMGLLIPNLRARRRNDQS